MKTPSLCRHALLALALVVLPAVGFGQEAGDRPQSETAPPRRRFSTKDLFKPGALPAVGVLARPLADDRLALTIVFYNKQTRKLQKHALAGTVDDLDTQVRTLAEQGTIPLHVQDLLEVALQRLRTRRSVARPVAKPSARQDELDRPAKKN